VLFGLSGKRILAYSEVVDMRKSFNGLIALTAQVMKEDPLSGDLYVFRNRRGNLIKILSWDRTGYCLHLKRLENGKFSFVSSVGKYEISEQRLKLLLDGIALKPREKTKKVVGEVIKNCAGEAICAK